MNYRHAYHAGNFADCMKHALFVRILNYLGQKEAPFRIVDTHAGIGLYDLNSIEAGKTLEWKAGIAQLSSPLNNEAEALLSPYREALAWVAEKFGEEFYPGSPMLAKLLMRRQDRAIFVEKHPTDARLLEEALTGDKRLKVLSLDGWTALKANIPPKERRGVVLIDPPFEVDGELNHLGYALIEAQKKWNGGIFVGWYPIKGSTEPNHLAEFLRTSGVKKILRLEMLIDDTDNPTRLNGSGLIVINPPWTLPAEAEILLPALAERLSRTNYANFRCEWITGE